MLEMGEQLHGGVVIMCKSGKDRTGMVITYRNALLLEQAQLIDKNSFKTYLDIMRGYGTRIMNAEKNTGKAQYMFNIVQNQFLPAQLKAPRMNRGHGIT